MTSPEPTSRGLIALIAGATCIGFAPIWVRWSEIGPVATAFHRVFLALPILAFWAAREGRGDAQASPALDRRWIVGSGVFFALDLAAWHASIRFTSVANATLLANFAPIFVTLGAWLFLHERAGARFFAGMLLALVGAGLLTGASLVVDPQQARGDVLGLATAFFYGGYQLCVARLRRHHRSGRILFWSSAISAPLLCVAALALGESILPATGNGWLVLLGLAITAQALGQGLITFGFAHLPAGYSSLTLLVQPFVAALAGWALLGERLDFRQVAGGLVLLAGLVIARHRTRLASSPRAGSGT